MDFLNNYAINIVSVLMLSVIIEIIMPNSSFKKYIKMVMGLLIIFFIISPVLDLSRVEKAVFDINYEYQEISQSQDEIYQKQQSTINSMFCENLQSEIENSLESNYSVKADVKIDFDGEKINSITIFSETEISHQIKNHIQNDYGIENIIIKAKE